MTDEMDEKELAEVIFHSIVSLNGYFLEAVKKRLRVEVDVTTLGVTGFSEPLPRVEVKIYHGML